MKDFCGTQSNVRACVWMEVFAVLFITQNFLGVTLSSAKLLKIAPYGRTMFIIPYVCYRKTLSELRYDF